MVALKKYNLNGDEVGEVSVDDVFLEASAHRQMVKDYIVALRANARQWSANTKTRSEVSHSKKKPWRQKGTGNARQGSLASPQFRGGSIVFGPKPKFDQHVRINRKERRLATQCLLAEKIKSEKLIVVEDSVFNGTLDQPKTKQVAAFLKKRGLVGKRLLFVGEANISEGKSDEESHGVFKKSMRNLPRTIFALAPNLNGYDVLAAQSLVVTEKALAEMMNLLSGKK